MIPRRTSIQSVNSDSSEDEDSGCQVTPRTKVSFVARIRSFCFELLLDYCRFLQFYIHSLAFLVSLCRRPISTMRILIYFCFCHNKNTTYLILYIHFTFLADGRSWRYDAKRRRCKCLYSAPSRPEHLHKFCTYIAQTYFSCIQEGIVIVGVI